MTAFSPLFWGRNLARQAGAVQGQGGAIARMLQINMGGRDYRGFHEEKQRQERERAGDIAAHEAAGQQRAAFQQEQDERNFAQQKELIELQASLRPTADRDTMDERLTEYEAKKKIDAQFAPPGRAPESFEDWEKKQIREAEIKRDYAAPKAKTAAQDKAEHERFLRMGELDARSRFPFNLLGKSQQPAFSETGRKERGTEQDRRFKASQQEDRQAATAGEKVKGRTFIEKMLGVKAKVDEAKREQEFGRKKELEGVKTGNDIVLIAERLKASQSMEDRRFGHALEKMAAGAATAEEMEYVRQRGREDLEAIRQSGRERIEGQRQDGRYDIEDARQRGRVDLEAIRGEARAESEGQRQAGRMSLEEARQAGRHDLEEKRQSGRGDLEDQRERNRENLEGIRQVGRFGLKEADLESRTRLQEQRQAAAEALEAIRFGNRKELQEKALGAAKDRAKTSSEAADRRKALSDATEQTMMEAFMEEDPEKKQAILRRAMEQNLEMLKPPVQIQGSPAEAGARVPPEGMGVPQDMDDALLQLGSPGSGGPGGMGSVGGRGGNGPAAGPAFDDMPADMKPLPSGSAFWPNEQGVRYILPSVGAENGTGTGAVMDLLARKSPMDRLKALNELKADPAAAQARGIDIAQIEDWVLRQGR